MTVNRARTTTVSVVVRARFAGTLLTCAVLVAGMATPAHTPMTVRQ